VHLVGAVFEPAEVAFDAVVGGRAPDDGLLLRGGELPKGPVDGDLLLAAEGGQVPELHAAVLPPAKGLDGPLREGQGCVGDDQVEVDADGAAEAPAGVAGADRAVEREQVRQRGAVGDLAEGALQAAAEGVVPARRHPQVQPAAAEAEGELDGIEHTLLLVGPEDQPVGHHRDLAFIGRRRPFRQGNDPPVPVETVKAQRHERAAQFLGARARHRNGKGDDQRGARRQVLKPVPDVLRSLRHHRPAAGAAVQAAETGVEQLHVVRDLGHGAHGGARRAHRVLAVDGDGGRDPLDLVHLGAVHAVHELAGVGREGLDVAPLAFGVERVEGERRLARAAHPGDHRDAVQGDVEIEVFEIVLACAGNTYDLVWHGVVAHLSWCLSCENPLQR